MKRFCLLVFLFLLAFPLRAKNKISMVTYFPVPYVAYSQVKAGQMDVGLTSSCDMKLGCDAAVVPLQATTLNLSQGRVNLNGGLGILGNTLTLGSGSSGTGNIQFNNVRIHTGNMESVHAQDMNINTLNLFGKEFPSCKEMDASGQMSWKSLKLQGAAAPELYLVCGDLEASNPEEKEGCSGAEPSGHQRVCPTVGVCGWQYSHYECVNNEWQEFWDDCIEISNPLDNDDNVSLLYKSKAACCPHVDPKAEVEYWKTDLWGRYPDYLCYRSRLVEVEKETLLGIQPQLCPIDEDVDICPGGVCDAKDIFEVDCLYFMKENYGCEVKKLENGNGRGYFLFNHPYGYWNPWQDTLYRCNVEKNY